MHLTRLGLCRRVSRSAPSDAANWSSPSSPDSNTGRTSLSQAMSSSFTCLVATRDLSSSANTLVARAATSAASAPSAGASAARSSMPGARPAAVRRRRRERLSADWPLLERNAPRTLCWSAARMFTATSDAMGYRSARHAAASSVAAAARRSAGLRGAPGCDPSLKAPASIPSMHSTWMRSAGGGARAPLASRRSSILRRASLDSQPPTAPAFRTCQ
mmetsp:Transcript_43117/g.137701  ORF Transcript_43117/g.137701 Transcript_43117/m.137701 type:complete len:217 (+) Transcript_43117:28-678(+)